MKSEILKFASPSDSEYAVVLNQDPYRAVLLERPDMGIVCKLIEKVESEYLSLFWEQLLLNRSPYDAGRPFALAAFKGGQLLLNPTNVTRQLALKSGEPCNVKAGEYFKNFSFSELQSAIRDLKPTTIAAALELLTQTGKQRMHAVSLLECAKNFANFDELVNELTSSGTRNRFEYGCTLCVLVAMRSEGWIILPTKSNNRLGRARGKASTDDSWLDPSHFLSAELEQLENDLATRSGGPIHRVKNERSKVRHAVYCTNLRDVRDISWLLAAEILKKASSGVDPTRALREHWRELCRANAQPSIELMASSFAHSGCGSDVDNPLARLLQEKAAVPHPCCKSTEYVSPRDQGYKVVFNQDTEAALIVAAPSREEIEQVLSDSEQYHIDKCWEWLCRPSPFVQNFPNALALTARGHTAIMPAVVCEKITGHVDLNNNEALEELRRYPLSELTSAVLALKPSSVSKATAMMTTSGRTRFQAFSVVDILGAEGSLQSLVPALLDIATRTGAFTAKRFAQLVLVAFRSKKWVALPLTLCGHIGKVIRGIHAKESWIPDPMDLLMGTVRVLHDALLADGSDDPLQVAACRIAVLCTSMRSPEDISVRLVNAILAGDCTSSEQKLLGTPSALRSRWYKLCGLNGPTALLELNNGNNHERELAKRSPEDSRLAAWITLLAEQCDLHQGGNLTPVYQAYGQWLSWLASLDVVPTIFELSRNEHIVNCDSSVNTFRSYVQRVCKTAAARNRLLHKMDTVFERVFIDSEQSGKRFVNPIRFDLDRFARPRNERLDGTNKQRIADWALERLKSLIVIAEKGGRYTWNEEVKKIGVTSLTLSDGEVVFCPILPAIVYIMLVFPLRTHQARWLDSGEMDGRRFDFDALSFIPNERFGMPKRESGVIRPASHKPHGYDAESLTFQVAVNKTLIQGRQESSFTIPYFPPDVLWVVRQVLEWQEKYGPPPSLVKEVQEPINQRMRNHQLADYYPDICSLFRYPSQELFYPPTHQQISYFWGRLCGVWDRIQEESSDKKALLKLSRAYRGKNGKNLWQVGIYGLHSLRVAGVSRLLDAGLPLGIVAAVAGHRALAMTLYYYRAEQEMLRVKLHDAFKKIGNSNALLEIANRIRETEDDSWLIGKPEGLSNLRAARKTGLMSITLSGICPGATCSTGLDTRFKFELGNDVPGSRCPLCKYHIYGPAFLVGLIIDFNCLLFELEKKAHRLVEIRNAALDAEDCGNEGELLRLRGDDDRIDQECTLDLAVLARISEMIDECITKDSANSDSKSKSGLELIVQERVNVGAALEHVTMFRRLKDLAEVAEVLPVSRHTAPQLAQIELKDRLLNLLYRNGVKPYLAGLSGEVSNRASLNLARLLESLIPQEDLRQTLLDGVVSLQEFPAVKEQVIEHATRAAGDLEGGSVMSSNVRQLVN